MNYDELIKARTKRVIQMLVNKEYDALVRYTNGKRLPKEEIVYAIGDYGCTIITPPDSVYDELDVIEVDNPVQREWSVRSPLWTREEGRSDLGIELSILEDNKKGFRVELDNMIVF